ncbi:MAG: tyrosine-type recombinase/integrase [Flavobacteriales bacterium]|nr:tyrosine-type recombinase/integrase [Flavobacteriales bacterium]
MIQSFIGYLQHEKNYSLHTIEAYKRDLIDISSFLDDKYSVALEGATHQFIRSWMVESLEKGLSASSVKRKVSALKSYFKWYKRSYSDFADPTAKIILPKVPKRLPVFVEASALNEEKLHSFFGDSFDKVRDRVVVELFYHTGIRSAELIDLKLNNVSFEKCEIKVRGKRNKERIIPVGKLMMIELENYLSLRFDLATILDDEFFFLTSKGKKLYAKLVYRVVNDYLSKVSSLNKKSPHVLRHTFATHLLNKGADINAIKELLGHSSLAATQVYTHNSVEQLIKVYQSSHPKS